MLPSSRRTYSRDRNEPLLVPARPSGGTISLPWHGPLGNAIAVVVHLAEIVLGHFISLVGGHTEPFQCLGIVLGNDLADEIHAAELIWASASP